MVPWPSVTTCCGLPLAGRGLLHASHSPCSLQPEFTCLAGRSRVSCVPFSLERDKITAKISVVA